MAALPIDVGKIRTYGIFVDDKLALHICYLIVAADNQITVLVLFCLPCTHYGKLWGYVTFFF